MEVVDHEQWTETLRRRHCRSALNHIHVHLTVRPLFKELVHLPFFLPFLSLGHLPRSKGSCRRISRCKVVYNSSVYLVRFFSLLAFVGRQGREKARAREREGAELESFC